MEGFRLAQWIYQDYTIGSALQKLRRQSNLSQEEVAAQLQVLGCNISRSMYAQIETGSYGIKVSVLIALKQIFHAEYADFFVDLP